MAWVVEKVLLLPQLHFVGVTGRCCGGSAMINVTQSPQCYQYQSHSSPPPPPPPTLFLVWRKREGRGSGSDSCVLEKGDRRWIWKPAKFLQL